jgi:RimJ/RimL family protein N-acetyltransferase
MIEEDIKDILDMYTEKDTFKYISTLRGLTLDEHKEKLYKKLAINDFYKIYGFMVIRDRTDDRFIGTLNYYPLDKQATGYDFKHIGAHFKSDFWSKGYAKECLLALMEYLFTECEEPEILAILQSEHKVSKKLLKSLGFIFKKNIAFGNEELEMFALKNMC